jgi:hypothetical protein
LPRFKDFVPQTKKEAMDTDLLFHLDGNCLLNVTIKHV